MLNVVTALQSDAHASAKHMGHACIITLATLVLVSYMASLNTGFYTDDYVYLEFAGKMPAPEYLWHVLDPRSPFMTYRPLIRIFFLAEYLVFGFDPLPYHLVHLLVHLANVIILFALIRQLGARDRVAFIASALYATAPVYSWAVLWISVHDLSATLFYLCAFFFWVRYLQTERRRDYLIAIAMWIVALLGKETSITAPIIFFLIDRMLVRKKWSSALIVRRYALIAAILIAYLALEYTVQIQGIFVREGGYEFGRLSLANGLTYLAMLVSPWGLGASGMLTLLHYIWLTIILVLFTTTLIYRRSVILAFLGLVALILIAPVSPIPWGSLGRYLYTAAIVPPVVLALLIERGAIRFRTRAYQMSASLVIVAISAWNGYAVAEETKIFSQETRQKQTPYEEIMRQHPIFPADTLLYFIEPNNKIPDLGAMFFQRYGRVVSVGGTFEDGTMYAVGRVPNGPARLRDHAKAYVYFALSPEKFAEVEVQRAATTNASLALPVDFDTPIRLEGYEIANTNLARDEPLVLILYWRAAGRITQDYMVWVDVLDQAGQLLRHRETMPRDGQERTRVWQANRFTADAHIISIPPGKNYRIHLGLFDPTSGARVEMWSASSHARFDHLEIQTFNAD